MALISPQMAAIMAATKAKTAPAPAPKPVVAAAPKPAAFNIDSLRALQETRYPELKAKRLADEKAAVDKAAYDKIPYATHLANAQAELAAAKAAQAAWKPEVVDPSKMTAQQKAAAKIPALAAFANPNFAKTKDAEANVKKLINQHLKDQLVEQSGGYGFDWKGNKTADYHTGLVAGTLAKAGITDLKDVTYDKSGNLVSKSTGAVVPWRKGKVGQIGFGAKGAGRTNYMVKADAQGNPVFYPQWKSNAPTGVGGFLLKAAPVLANFIPGIGPLGAAAINAGLTAAQGGGIGDILKSGALSYAGAKIAPNVSNLATSSLPMIGNATITNAIADSLGGAASGAARSAITGQNILSGAGTGALGAAIGSVASGVASQVPKDLTGVPIVDRNLASLAGDTTSGVLQGRNALDALVGSLAPIAGREVAGAAANVIPKTGNTYLDSLIKNAAGAGTKIGLKELLASGPSRPSSSAAPAPPPAGATATAPAPAPAPAPSPATAPNTGSTNGLSNNYMALFPLLAASMSGNQTAPEQQLAQLGTPYDVSNMFDMYGKPSVYAQGGQVDGNESMQQLLALLRSSGKIA